MDNYQYNPLSFWVDDQRRIQDNGSFSGETICTQNLQLFLIDISDKLELLSLHNPDVEREIAEIIDEFGLLSFLISGTDLKRLYRENWRDSQKK